MFRRCAIVLIVVIMAFASIPSTEIVRADDWTPLWTTSTLSVGRQGVAATAVGGKIYFGGGRDGYFTFSTVVDIYDTASNTWTKAGEVPLTQLPVPVVAWRGRHVIPNGEIRPGVRTPEVWSFRGPSIPIIGISCIFPSSSA